MSQPQNDKKTGLSRLFCLIAGDSTPTDRNNNAVLTRWSMVWALWLIAAAWVLRFAELSGPLVWLVALSPNVAALFVVQRYLRFLRMTDELIKRIHLEGLAVGFGVSYAFVIGYSIAEHAGAPPLNLAVMVLLMTFGWLAGNVSALRRYK